MPPAIQVEKLTKQYRIYKKEPGLWGAAKGLFKRAYEDVRAVNQVSFTVDEGEIVGFLGSNGAGKTTTLKMLAGLLHPTSGQARVLGHVPWRRENQYRRQFALLLGQKNQLWWDLPARDSLELNSRIYDIPQKQFEQTLDELTHLLQVREKLNVMVRELSLGERMKMELIAAILHRPKVLFLDEPTIGLDVVSQKSVREFLRQYNADHQTTILLTSHYMADIEALCRRVILVDNGAIAFDGQLHDVLNRFANYKVIRFETNDATPAKHFLDALGEVAELHENMARLKVKRDRVTSVCKTLLDHFAVKDLEIQEIPIEDVLRDLYEGKLELLKSFPSSRRSSVPILR